MKMTLYMSVSPDGYLSLWDSQAARFRGTQLEDRYVDLELRPDQVRQLFKTDDAMTRARDAGPSDEG